MQFLKTLFWVIIAVAAVVFSYRNWTPTTVHLWGGLEADTKLPVLMLIAFLVGFLPWFILHKATRWQLKRRLEAAQRALEQARTQTPETTDAVPADPSPRISQTPNLT